MSLQNATPAALAFARFFSRPNCPECRDLLLVPESSEFAGQGQVNHTWLCEACGHEFRTSVKFGRRAA